MITSPGHVPRRGHRDAVTLLVTLRAGPSRAGPCPGADARLRPERPMRGAGARAARQSEAAEGLRKFGQLFEVQICGHESVERTEDRGHFKKKLNDLRADVQSTSFKIADDNNQYSRACDKTIKLINKVWRDRDGPVASVA